MSRPGLHLIMVHESMSDTSSTNRVCRSLEGNAQIYHVKNPGRCKFLISAVSLNQIFSRRMNCVWVYLIICLLILLVFIHKLLVTTIFGWV